MEGIGDNNPEGGRLKPMAPVDLEKRIEEIEAAEIDVIKVTTVYGETHTGINLGIDSEAEDGLPKLVIDRELSSETEDKLFIPTNNIHDIQTFQPNN